jgi:hypothetical protein
VADLTEQNNESLNDGDRLFYASREAPQIVSRGREGVIDWWHIKSGEKVYEVRRFQNFVWCECRSFQFSKKMCKHLAATAGVKCERCRTLTAKVGKLCFDCDGVVNKFNKKEKHT